MKFNDIWAGIKSSIVGHRIGFTKGDRCQPVRIHASPASVRSPTMFRTFISPQNAKPALDRLLVRALVGCAQPKERQKCHRRRAVTHSTQSFQAGCEHRPVRGQYGDRNSSHHRLLVLGQPFQCRCHRCFAPLTSALFVDRCFSSLLAAPSPNPSPSPQPTLSIKSSVGTVNSPK